MIEFNKVDTKGRLSIRLESTCEKFLIDITPSYVKLWDRKPLMKQTEAIYLESWVIGNEKRYFLL
jgi:hypothetical protein